MNKEYLIIVNNENMLSNNYIPADLIYPNVMCDYMDEKKFMRQRAAFALENLFFAAFQGGYELVAISGFRSYARQMEIYKKSLEDKGVEHTSKYIARPGTSEHQTGLAMDVSSKSIEYELEESFADTPEGIWLAGNAYRYGFIIRYPKGKKEITGFEYEPWHIRYVGKKVASQILLRNITFDEYYKEKYGDLLIKL